MEKDFVQIIGKRIATKRKQKRLSQEKLAELTDLHRTYIGAIENGKFNASLKTLKKVSEALNYPLEKLFKNF